jgi:hypothetical protein
MGMAGWAAYSLHSNAMCEFRFSLYGLCFSRAFYHVASRRKRRKFAHRVFYLCWKELLHEPLLYLSYYFKLNRQEYYDRLNTVRRSGDYEQWIAFFLRGVVWTADSALDTVRKILSLAESHKKLLIQKKASSPMAIALLDYLFVNPLISCTEIETKLEVSHQTARNVIQVFVDLNILKEITGRKRSQRFSYWQYLQYLSEGTQPLSQ